VKRYHVVVLLTVAMVLSMIAQVCAQGKSLKTYTDKTLKFTIQYPNGWKIEKEEGKGDRVYFASTESDTIVAVSVINAGKKIGSKEFLLEMEKKLNVKNLMDTKDRPFDEEACQAVNVDEGYCGSYMMKQDGKDVFCMMNVFIKGTKVYFLMMSASVQDELDKFEDILASFKAL